MIINQAQTNALSKFLSKLDRCSDELSGMKFIDTSTLLDLQWWFLEILSTGFPEESRNIFLMASHMKTLFDLKASIDSKRASIAALEVLLVGTTTSTALHAGGSLDCLYNKV